MNFSNTPCVVISMWRKCCCVALLIVTVINDNHATGEIGGQSNTTIDIVANHEFTEFIGQKDVTAVVFQFPDPTFTENVNMLLDTCAKKLMKYDIQIRKFVCESNSILPYCRSDKKISSGSLHIFKNGTTKMEIVNLDKSDTYVILSSILHVKFIKEVPILQSYEEKLKIEDECKGKSNILLALVDMFTYHHFMMLHMASLNLFDDLRYVIAADPKVVTKPNLPGGFDDNDEEELVLLLLTCKYVSGPEECPTLSYQGSLSVQSLTNFHDLLQQPFSSEVDMSEDKMQFEKDDRFISAVVLVVYDYKTKEQVKETADILGKSFIGQIKVFTVNFETTSVEAFKEMEMDRSVIQTPAVIFLGPTVAVVASNYENPLEFVRIEYAKMKKYEFQENICESGVMATGPLKQDDMISNYVAEVGPVNLSHFIHITETTRPTVSTELSFVFYYVQWDHLCQAALHVLSDVSKYFKAKDIRSNPVKIINCYDWNEICENDDVFTYPSMKIYGGYGQSTAYDGMIDRNEIINYIYSRNVTTPIVLDTERDVRSYVDGRYLDTQRDFVTSYVLGIFTSKNSKEYEIYEEASVNLHGKVLMAATDAKNAKFIFEKYNLKDQPAHVLVVRSSDPYKPFVVHSPTENDVNVTELIIKSMIPSMAELTGGNFQDYFKSETPLVILFDEEDAKDVVGKIAASMDHYLFVWMNKNSNLTRNVLKDYGLSDTQGSFVSVLDRSQESLYVYDDGIVDCKLRKWLSTLPNSSTITKTLINKEWKPLVEPYDYLSLEDHISEYSDEDDLTADGIDQFNAQDDNISETEIRVPKTKTAPDVVVLDSESESKRELNRERTEL